MFEEIVQLNDAISISGISRRLFDNFDYYKTEVAKIVEKF